jgi:hypothetical protein
VKEKEVYYHYDCKTTGQCRRFVDFQKVVGEESTDSVANAIGACLTRHKSINTVEWSKIRREIAKKAISHKPEPPTTPSSHLAAKVHALEKKAELANAKLAKVREARARLEKAREGRGRPKKKNGAATRGVKIATAKASKLLAASKARQVGGVGASEEPVAGPSNIGKKRVAEGDAGESAKRQRAAAQ